MESYTYKQFQGLPATVHVALFASVKNAAELRARIVKASTAEGAEGEAAREAVNFAFIEARLVTSRQHLQTAVYQSLLAEAQGALKTKTLHSEILWSLNPTNNITEALRRFGVSDSSASLFVVRVGSNEDANKVLSSMKAVVDGVSVPLNALDGITDWASVKKYYKLNGEPAIHTLEQNHRRHNVVVDELVTSLVAMKTVMS